ncbi:MAG TPA: hypothetical protein VFC94_03390 [Bacteroidaceae bacterium]|nr:hypothetical protein [Bacteroidaceae bacterium]
MKKLFLLSLLILASCFSVLTAGGLVTNTNHSAAFLRNPARNATIDLDAVYYNPAGVAFMNNGFHFGINNQSAFQKRDITATIQNNNIVPPASIDNKKYEGKITSPIIPSIHFAYVSDRWSVSSHFGIPGGGGELDYANGLPMFDVMVRGLIFNNVYTALIDNSIPAATAAIKANSAAGAAMVNSSFTGKTFLFGWQIGGTYKLTDYLSAYAGARLSFAKSEYVGQVSYKVGDTGSLLGLNCEQSGLGIAPIIGLDYKVDNLNLAVKYEFGSKIEVENNTTNFPAQFNSVPSLTRFKDGVKTQADQPSLLTVGAAYNVLSKLRVSAGFHYYFDKNTDYNGLEDQINKNTTEYLLGAEYALSEKLTISAGTQFTNYDVKDNYNSNTGFIMSSYSIGGGLRYNVSSSLALDLGVLWTNFEDYSKTSNYSTIEVFEEYERKSIAVGVGAVWSL